MNALEDKLEAMMITKPDRKTKQGRSKLIVSGTSEIGFKKQNPVLSTTRFARTQLTVPKLSIVETTASM